MFENIEVYKNPRPISVTVIHVASIVLTIVTAVILVRGELASDVILVRGELASESLSRLALLATFVGTVEGKNGEAMRESLSWEGWRNFIVTRKVVESAAMTSFYLQPENEGKIPNFLPGQLLPIKLAVPGEEEPLIRNYYLSDYNRLCKDYRLSIPQEEKLESLDNEGKATSKFICDEVQVGTIIAAKPPQGEFVLEPEKSSPVILISDGVGVAPMISMAKAVSFLNPERHVWLLHRTKNGRFHAFREEMLVLSHQVPHLHIHFRYSHPRQEDKGQYHSIGYLDLELLQEEVAPEVEKFTNLAAVQFYLCGSPPFLNGMIPALQEWGIPQQKISFSSYSQQVMVSE